MQTSACPLLPPEPWTCQQGREWPWELLRGSPGYAQRSSVGASAARFPTAWPEGCPPDTRARGSLTPLALQVRSAIPTPATCLLHRWRTIHVLPTHRGAVVARVSGLSCIEPAGPAPTLHALPRSVPWYQSPGETTPHQLLAAHRSFTDGHPSCLVHPRRSGASNQAD